MGVAVGPNSMQALVGEEYRQTRTGGGIALLGYLDI